MRTKIQLRLRDLKSFCQRSGQVTHAYSFSDKEMALKKSQANLVNVRIDYGMLRDRQNTMSQAA